MNDIEKRARELLAAEYEKSGLSAEGHLIRLGVTPALKEVGALIAAITPLKGYALIPVEPTPAMVEAAAEAYMPFGDMETALRMAILAEVSP